MSRAILSVADKTGLVEFARELVHLGVELYATGGTERALTAAGVAVQSVEKLTGFPEVLGGRVKTLHPAIHAGILARPSSKADDDELARHHILPIDLVVVNLYPFRQTIEAEGSTIEDAVEQIDIGGVTLLRAGAKNFARVTVVVDPADYAPVLEALRDGGLPESERQRLAAKAFQHTAVYDTHIAGYLRDSDDLFPDHLTVALEKRQGLRYGENPHQQAALYVQTPSPKHGATLAGARQVHGKALSFNNILDLDAALSAVRDFAACAVAVVKHGGPCGLACADSLVEAYRKAHAGDPLSAFGGCVGLNRVVDAETATEIAQTFYEDIVAPGFTEEALKILRRKRDLRLVEVDLSGLDETATRISPTLGFDFKRVSGGFLIQTLDAVTEDQESYRVVTEREPTLEELTDLLFAWRAVKHVRSNAIVLARGLALVGVGGGQPSRVDAVEIAARKAGDRAIGSVLASDAFFPKPDGIEAAARAGATAIIQPGGSIRDDETIREANKHHLAMIFTGYRHFRH